MSNSIDSILNDLDFNDSEKEIFKKSINLTKLAQNEGDIDVKKIVLEEIGEEFD